MSDPSDGNEGVNLSEKQRILEEKNRERANFLKSMDNFSQLLESQTLSNESEKAKLKDSTIISEEIKRASSNYTAPPPVPTFVPVPVIQTESVTSTNNNSNNSITEETSVTSSTIVTVESASNTTSNGTFIELGIDSNKSGAFNSLASSLFATGNNDNSSISNNAKNPFDEDINQKDKSNNDELTMATTISSKKFYQPPKPIEDDDEAEEGTKGIDHISNILTLDERKNMTETEKATWRALQADLTTRRKDYHGAVTLAFDGIFSWQMYGSAEALDETGKAYTEYLMRCQYGTTWDNLQPWIVARRYREFDQLDLQLRKYYPTLAKSLIKLPEKDYFRFLEADVVEKRRLALEDYMYTVVVKLPSILRSDLFNEFLGIHERIYTIRTKLGGFVYDASAGNNSNTLPLSNDELDGILSDISLVLTYDKAESIREATNCQSFDEDGLGRLEEDVRDLCNMLKRATVHDLTSNSKFRNLFTSCSQRWPRLRATTVVGASDLDFTLIPRAMQTEEDLIRAVDEFKSLVEAGKMLSTV
jgi:hypothetical protein